MRAVLTAKLADATERRSAERRSASSPTSRPAVAQLRPAEANDRGERAETAAEGFAEQLTPGVAGPGASMTPFKDHLPPSLINAALTRFGLDLSQVRVHSDARAGQAAMELGADAVTVGQDIAFAPARFNLDTRSGTKLIAHEIAHTAQQRRGSARSSSLPQTRIEPALKANPAAVARMDAQTAFRDPDYVDNNLVGLDYFGGQATLRYSDGNKLTLGLQPPYIKAPFESVDFKGTYALLAPPGQPARTLEVSPKLPERGTAEEVFREAGKAVAFKVEGDSGKIVPNHLNSGTAARLCAALRTAESEFTRDFDAYARGMVKVLEKERLIIYLMMLKTAVAPRAPQAPQAPRAPLAAAAGEDLVGPIGRLTANEIEEAVAASGGRTVDLYTKLTQTPAAGRVLSCATEPALAQAARASGQVFIIRVPYILLQRLQFIGLVEQSTTIMGSVTATEIRVLAPAAATVLRFLAGR